MKSILFLIVFAAGVGSVFADATNAPVAATASTSDLLDNSAVIQLKQLGLGDGVVIAKIKSSHCSFDTGLNGLKQLKAANVSDDVITAMLSAGTIISTEKSSASTPMPIDLADPKSPHDAGIYYYEEQDGKVKLTELEPTVYTQVKNGVGIFMAYGQTVNSKAVLHPAHAMLQCTNQRPVFYFYFESTQAGLGDTKNIATSPNEFVLAQFEIKDKDNLRSLIVGQFNAYSGSQSGPKDQSVRPMDAVKISPGIYKVTPREDLANGEYCFFYGGDSTFGSYGATGGHKVFDFGIQGSTVGPPAVENVKKRGK